jgi:hypothetical protein
MIAARLRYAALVRWTGSLRLQRGWSSFVTRDLMGRSHESVSRVGSTTVKSSSFSAPQNYNNLLKDINVGDIRHPTSTSVIPIKEENMPE